MGSRLFLFLLSFLHVCTSVAGASDLRECVSLEAGARATCVDRWLGERKVDPSRLARLGDLPEEHPEFVIELVERVELPGDLSVNPTRAAIQDLRGRSLQALGRTEEATQAFSRAIAFNDGLSRLTWFDDDGERTWTAPVDAGLGRHLRLARAIAASGRNDVARALLLETLGLDPGDETIALWKSLGGRAESTLSPKPLAAPIWSPALPPVEINLYDGGVFRPADVVGDVLILTFWATWCQPCQEELPMLQKLYESARDDGLSIIAINGQEPKGTALPFARQLGLTMPIAHYQAKFHEMLNVTTLPTTILIDRWGRMQGRWTGYEPGQEREIERNARLILAMRDQPMETIAEVLVGDGLLEAVWSREISAPIDGLALEQSETGPNLLLSTARAVLVIDGSGETVGRRKGDAILALMRRADLDGDGEAELVGFRRGGSNLIRLSGATWELERREAPHPVLDVELLHASDPDSKGTTLLGTVSGLYSELDGAEPVRIEGIEVVQDIAVLERAEGIEVLALDGDVSWRRVDLEAPSVADPVPAPAGTHRILPGRSGFGFAPRVTTAATEVAILPAGAAAVAAATASGQLVLLDSATGSVRFRARWDGVNDLLAADLDGDGLEELIVAAGRRVTVLRARGASSDSRTESPD